MIGPDDFRRALGHFATGVTVVTTRDAEGRPAGLTASAVASVSLDPPLVLVCVDQDAECHGAFADSRRFAINVLAEEHEAVSRRFATRRLDKFDAGPFRTSDLGLPLLDDALAQIECTTVHHYAGGDHTIFVGLVERAEARAGRPLLYFRGQYDRLSGEKS